MAKYRCKVCEYTVDEDKNDSHWIDLPEPWSCPVCGSPKKLFDKVEESSAPVPDLVVDKSSTVMLKRFPKKILPALKSTASKG